MFASIKKKPQSKNKRREAAFVFTAVLTSKRPMKSDKEREARVCEYKKKPQSKNKRREAEYKGIYCVDRG